MNTLVRLKNILFVVIIISAIIIVQLYGVHYSSASGSTAPVGTNTSLSSVNPILVSYKGASQYTAAENGTISSLNMYIDGDYGTSGTQSVLMAVYADSSNAPGALLGSTPAKTITAGRAAGWVNFTLSSTLSVTSGEKLWLAAYSPSGSNIIRIYYDTAANYSYTNNVNSGSTISNPFGSAGIETGRYDMYASETLKASTNPALTTWQTALANRSTAPAKWVNIGDSISEGQGATVRSNRWLDLSAAQLRSSYQTSTIAGGENYIPAIYDVFGVSSGWATPYSASTGTISPVSWPADLGYRAEELSGTGSSLTYPVTGNSADIWYTQGDTGGTFTYQVDGGTPVSVNSYSTTYSTAAQISNVSLGTSGSHSITITVTSGSVVLEGFTVYNGDRSAGIQVYDSAQTGSSSNTFVADLSDFDTALAAVGPQLVTIELGENDWIGQTSPTTYESNMQALVSSIENLPTHPSIELIMAYQAYEPNVNGYPFSDYESDLQSIANADPSQIAFLDLNSLMPVPNGGANQTYYDSDSHPNNAGQTLLESYVYSSLTK